MRILTAEGNFQGYARIQSSGRLWLRFTRNRKPEWFTTLDLLDRNQDSMGIDRTNMDRLNLKNNKKKNIRAKIGFIPHD